MTSLFAGVGRRLRGGGASVPNVGPLRAAATNYFTAARESGVNKANISKVNAAIKNLAAKAYSAAQAPLNQQPPAEALAAPQAPQGPTNYGLTQAYKNLANKLETANKNALTNLVSQARVAMNASKNNTTVNGLRANVNAQVKKANALAKANTRLTMAIKSFLATTAVTAKKNNANYNARLNYTFNGLGNLKPIFQANYNKAKANASKTETTINTAIKAAPKSIKVGNKTFYVNNKNNAVLGTKIYKVSNTGNGRYVQGVLYQNKGRFGFGGSKVILPKFNNRSTNRWAYNNSRRAFLRVTNQTTPNAIGLGF